MESIKNKSVLVVGAHSDDEVLGVGGTILKAKAQGCTVDVLIVTDSASTQYQNDEHRQLKRKSHLEESCSILGVDNFYQWDLPDMRLDTISHVELNQKIESLLITNSYNTVFIHHANDINMDHQVLFNSLMVATRPVPDQTVTSIYSYFTPSSSEWGGFDRSRIFCPNVFIDIGGFIDLKLKALNAYSDELRAYPHPRSIENVRNVAQYFGSQVGLECAEAFELIRCVQKRNLSC